MISDRVPRGALVTGGAKRVGRALVKMLVEQGFSVAIHFRNSRAEAEVLLTEIGGKGCVLDADLAREEEVASLVSRAETALGPLGILINNASTFERDEMSDATRESWDQHLESNLRAPFVLSQEMARRLPEGAEGLILNLLDQRVWNLTPHFVSYTVSKSGLWALTQSMSLAFAPRIRVNAIGPGPVLPAARQTQEQFDEMCLKTPLKRSAPPEEIAQGALALFSLPSVTGQMLAMDAGQHLNWGAPPSI